MESNTLKIAVIQTDLIWENPIQNRLLFTQKIKAITSKVDVIVLPELFTTGFTMNIDFAETMTGESVLWMQNLAQQQQVAIVGSLIIFEDKKYYNRLLFVHPNGKIEYYDKHHLFALSGEDSVFTGGTKKLIVNYKGWKICPLICYDLRFPVWSRNTQNYDLLLYVANWPTKRITAWKTLLKARAIENMSYTVGVNRVGVDVNGFEYNGSSKAYDSLGEELLNFKLSTTQTQVVVLDKLKQDVLRKNLGFLNGIITE